MNFFKHKNSESHATDEDSTSPFPSHVHVLKHPDKFGDEASHAVTVENTDLNASDDLQRRTDFIFACLVYTLNMNILYRFPQQTVLYGEAAFVYLYLIFTCIFGFPILFFEVAIGQYSNKGLINVFNSVPLFDGLKYSMLLYCSLITHIYNLIGVFDFFYLFTFIRHDAPLEPFQTSVYTESCRESENKTLEYLYFHHSVVMVSDELGCTFNFRNCAILLFIWIMIWVFAAQEYSNLRYFAMTIYGITISGIIITLGLSIFATEGTMVGLKKMFVPEAKYFKMPLTYLLSFEQSLVTLGLGMGPLIQFGSKTRFRSPVHKDCIIITLCSVVTSLLITSIVFCAVGITEKAGVTLDKDEYCYFVLLTRLFTTMDYGYKHVGILIFHFALMCTLFYSALKFSELFMHLAKEKLKLDSEHQILQTFVFSCIQFSLGCFTVSYLGYDLLQSTSKVFMTLSVLTLIFFEMCAFCYIYGINYFADDVEFMVGIYPNLFTRSVWLISPLTMLAVMVAIVSILCQNFGLTFYDIFSICLYITAIVLPVIAFAVYNGCVAYKLGHISYLWYRIGSGQEQIRLPPRSVSEVLIEHR